MCFKLAAVGDYGVDNSNELKVANMIAAWGVDGVLALGDNNYFVGSNSTIDAQVGKYYGSFIYPYKGTYGSGSPTGTNRFWPITGNHDWGNTCGDGNSGCSASCATGSLAAHLWYMPVGGKAYYNKVLAGGLLEIFALDSDCNQRDGTSPTSVQGQWLQNALAASTATWKFVLLHHSPFSSSTGHGTNPRLQWPFEQWGAHAVFSAHDHLYERITKNAGFPYFVNGAGGQSLNSFGTPESGSAVRYSTTHGAQLLTINATTADIAFYAATDATNPYASQVDCYRLTKPASGAVAYSSCAAGAPPPAAPQYSLLTGAAADDTAGTHNRVMWRYTSTAAAGGVDPAWAATSFADTSWKLGATRLGYGNDFVYNTTLPDAVTGLLHHWLRVYVCLPPTAPAALGSVRLKVLSDNTAEVFINGLRAYTDPAADHEPIYWNSLVNIAPGFVAGVNVIAVHVTNTAGSSDAAMDLDMTYVAAAPLPGVVQYSLMTGAVADNAAGTHNRVAWRYTSTAAAGGIDPAWAATSFADAAWKLGAARLGYGNDFVYNTTLPDAATGLLHHWFRVYVCLPASAPAALSSVRLKVLSDNTAEVFINGLRAYTDPAADHEPVYWNTAVNVSPGFVAGSNVIAVHVTNTAGSSDAAMDLDMTYVAATPLPGVVVSATGCLCSTTCAPR
ncbi:hypothetical protein OEZ86_012135 [Tetradesmus obliquus]|nr:hypothetical protein OEZ86_012135 [Tetradesmus obliquus]